MSQPNNESFKNLILLINDIKQGNTTTSYEIARRTFVILRQVISAGDWVTAEDLLKLIASHGHKLQCMLPAHASAINMVRLVMKIIRDEYAICYKSKSEGQQSLHQYVTAEEDSNVDCLKDLSTLRTAVLDHLEEFQLELDISAENIALQASDHIHSNEIIMTIGQSSVVEQFLKNAAKTRRFHVIVAECAPHCHGHELAASLGRSKIQTTVICDSAIFAMMSRVNKVIIGTQSVMADGGLRAVCGTHTVALAAKHYSVPVIVLAPMYKLSPVHLCSYEQDPFNINESPSNVLPYASGALQSKVQIYNPVFDYVPSDLVTLLISNQGGNSPSYIYRLLSELYHPDDYVL